MRVEEVNGKGNAWPENAGEMPDIEGWAAETGCTDCSGCPAHEWTKSDDGVRSCALGFGITEQNGVDRPAESCVRPKTVGASYLIAKALNRPEPMVGKPDRETYERYMAGKEQEK